MNDDKQFCDLCGLPVEVAGFELTIKDDTKHFCCEGCLRIFKMLNEDELPQESDNNQQ